MAQPLAKTFPLSLAALVLTLAGCAGDDEPEPTNGVDPGWYDALDRAVEKFGDVGPIPKLERGECPIESPEIAAEEVDGDPMVGLSVVEGSRTRLVCQWSRPATELVVVRFEDPAELEPARQEVSVMGKQDLGVNVQTTEAIAVGEREFVVRRTVYPKNDSHVDYSVWFFDDDDPGMVILDVETTKTRDLIKTYTAQQAAEDLADLLP